MENIKDQLYYLDRESVKPALWSQIIYNDDVYQKQILKIFEVLLDPRMIYVDQDLKYEEIKQCILYLKQNNLFQISPRIFDTYRRKIGI